MTRKWTFRANGQIYVLVKRPQEREAHVLMKAFLAKLYGTEYPTLRIEVPYAHEARYKPDALALNDQGEATFWGECGEVSREKLVALIKKYRDTHLCFSKWNVYSGNIRSGNIRPHPFEQMISQAVEALKRPRTAPIDFINFSEDHRKKIADDGEVMLSWDDVTKNQWR